MVLTDSWRSLGFSGITRFFLYNNDMDEKTRLISFVKWSVNRGIRMEYGEWGITTLAVFSLAIARHVGPTCLHVIFL